MKRFTYAIVMSIGLTMTACGSSGGGSSSTTSTCTTPTGQVVNGSVVNGVCQASATSTCTPCGTNMVYMPGTTQCVPIQYAGASCNTGYNYGYGYTGYNYPTYGYYGGGCSRYAYNVYGQLVCY